MLVHLPYYQMILYSSEVRHSLAFCWSTYLTTYWSSIPQKFIALGLLLIYLSYYLLILYFSDVKSALALSWSTYLTTYWSSIPQKLSTSWPSTSTLTYPPYHLREPLNTWSLLHSSECSAILGLLLVYLTTKWSYIPQNLSTFWASMMTYLPFHLQPWPADPPFPRRSALLILLLIYLTYFLCLTNLLWLVVIL